MVFFWERPGMTRFCTDSVVERVGTVICFGSVLFTPFCILGRCSSSCLSWLEIVVMALVFTLAWLAAWLKSCWRARPLGLLHSEQIRPCISVWVLILLMILASGLLLISQVLIGYGHWESSLCLD